MSKTEMAYLRSCQDLTECEAEQRRLIKEKHQAEQVVAEAIGKIKQNSIELQRKRQKFERLRVAFAQKMKFTPSKKGSVCESVAPSTVKRALYVNNFDDDEVIETQMVQMANDLEVGPIQKANADMSFDAALNALEQDN